MLTTPITKALSSSKSSDTDTHVPRDGDVQKNEDVAQPPLEIKVNQKSSGHVEKSIEVQNDKVYSLLLFSLFCQLFKIFLYF